MRRLVPLLALGRAFSVHAQVRLPDWGASPPGPRGLHPDSPPAPPAAREPVRRGPRRLSGPRTGLTFLSPGTVEQINDALDLGYCTYDYETGRESCEDESPAIDPSFPLVTQFGWQFEHRLFQAQSGLTGVSEWVLLVGGAERGLFLPSATFLAGVRAPSGVEIGVGPNLSLSGAAYALTVGMNNEMGEVSVPLNAAVVFGQEGPRVSLLVGFNVSDRRY